MPRISEIEAYETRLRSAMLAGDVGQLERLLSDELVFTAPDGQFLSKTDDLAAHRSGLLRFERIDVLEQRIRPVGDCMVVSLRADIGGHFGGQPFAGRGAYTRVWRHDGSGWVIAAGHCSITAT